MTTDRHIALLSPMLWTVMNVPVGVLVQPTEQFS